MRARLTSPRSTTLRRASTLLTALLTAVLVGAAPKFEDTMAQRMQACTGCHGPQGRAASDGYYPPIAGKPARYRDNRLLAFRDGWRRSATLTCARSPTTSRA